MFVALHNLIHPNRTRTPLTLVHRVTAKVPLQLLIVLHANIS